MQRDSLPNTTLNSNYTELKKLERLCYNFQISLVEQTCTGDKKDLTIFLPIAVMLLLPKGIGFREVYNFATDLSTIKKAICFAAVQTYYNKYAPTFNPNTLPNANNNALLTQREAKALLDADQVNANYKTTEAYS